MSWPLPRPGLVIRYSYLWHREAQAGREEGIKDRPCAVVIAWQEEDGRTRVYVLPISHSPPDTEDDAIEVPQVVKERLGLDGQRSWIGTGEANIFIWPGPDLRFLPREGPESLAYGFLPPSFFRVVRDRFLAAARGNRVKAVKRSE